MTKVSTITPCYNMSKYIKGFLDNLSTQTHKDLEIVLDHNEPTDEEIMLVEDYNKEHDDMYIGMEDVKLFVNNNNIEYSANRATIDTLKCVEHGIYDIDNNKIIESNILKYSKRTIAEKNWVLFNAVDNTRKFIYKWNPITICEKNENEFHNGRMMFLVTNLTPSSENFKGSPLTTGEFIK